MTSAMAAPVTLTATVVVISIISTALVMMSCKIRAIELLIWSVLDLLADFFLVVFSDQHLIYIYTMVVKDVSRQSSVISGWFM